MKLVRLDSLFEVTMGHGLNLCYLNKDINGVNFVSRSSKHLGWNEKVKQIVDLEPAPANTISVALGSSSALSTFVQPYPYYTGQNVAYLTELVEMSVQEKYYYVSCIRHNQFRYGYAREAHATLKSLMLPALSEIPNWVNNTVLPDYSYHKEAKLKLSEEERKELWASVEWGTFKLLDYFQSFGGKLLTNQWCLSNPGNINFITSSTSNNGVNQKIEAKEAIKEGATVLRNVISVSTNGQSCWAFYQNQPCVIGLDAVGLIPKVKLTKLQSLFVCQVIRKEAFRFNYGRKLNTERLEKLTIGLPKAQDGTPDWDLIEKLAASSDWTACINN